MERVVQIISSINNSRILAGLAMIMLNIGSRYITLELTPAQEKILKENLGRQMLIFSICWMGSRDIITAILLTAAFHILTMYVLNENSTLCILPESYKKVGDMIDTDGDGKISDEEINKAIEVLEAARKKEENKIQNHMVNNFAVSNDITNFSTL